MTDERPFKTDKDIWIGIRKSGGRVARQHWTEREAQEFLTDLERQGLTVLPVKVREAADIFGTAVMVRLADRGYAALDPLKVRVKVTEREDGPRTPATDQESP